MTEEALFLAAHDRPAPERAHFLDEACAHDPALRQRLDLLLAAFAAGRDKLEPPSESDKTSDYVAPEIAAGLVIAGRYKLLEKIGEGGMGEVWVAKQTEPVQRKVAVKLIKAGMDSQRVITRFEAERQALAMMDHPNIARVLDGGLTADRRPFFVMELVNGLPLTKFCDDAKLTPNERLELFVPICQAVQHAHTKGIVHRDLKPSNVLVTLYDGRPVPKVIDFGVAKATGGRLTDESLSTQFGAVLGTFEYMSPEQAGFSALDVDTRADVYSLGVILYELLTGLRPFDGQRLRQAAFDEMVRIIREEEPPRPSTKLSSDATLPSAAAMRKTEPKKLAALMRGDLDWIVMKALEKDRNRRYETATGFAADVMRYLAGEPVLAVPPSAGYRMRKFVRRHKGRVAAAGVLAAAMVLAVAGLAWGLVQSRRAEADARWAEANTRAAKEEADRQRETAERQAASITIDMELKLCEDVKQRELGLLRLASLVRSLPDHAHELRDSATLAVLCYGQKITPLVPEIPEDGFYTNHTITLSPDGRTLLSDGRAWLSDKPIGFARLTDVLTGQQISQLPAGEVIQHKEFAEKGRLVSIGNDGRVVRVWDTNGRLVMTTETFSGPIRGAVLSPDGQRLLVIADPESPLHTWLHNPREATRIELFDGSSGRRVVRLVGHTGPVRHAALSPDGRWVLTGRDDRTPRLWATADGRLAHTLVTLTAPQITWLGISPTGAHACIMAGGV